MGRKKAQYCAVTQYVWDWTNGAKHYQEPSCAPYISSGLHLLLQFEPINAGTKSNLPNGAPLALLPVDLVEFAKQAEHVDFPALKSDFDAGDRFRVKLENDGRSVQDGRGGGGNQRVHLLVQLRRGVLVDDHATWWKRNRTTNNI